MLEVQFKHTFISQKQKTRAFDGNQQQSSGRLTNVHKSNERITNVWVRGNAQARNVAALCTAGNASTAAGLCLSMFLAINTSM